MREPSRGGGDPARRIFLGWARPILHSVADRLVEAAGDQGPLDLSRILIVLPGARGGRRLRELLLERAEAGERPLRPPRILTAGRLPESLYTPERPAPDSLIERLAWRAALHSLAPADLEELLPADFWAAETDAGASPIPPTLETTIRSLHREVGGVGKDFGEVAALSRRAGSFNDEARWSVLASAQRRYRSILEDHGFRDREASRGRALAAGGLSCDSEIWIAGAPDLPGVVREFLAVAAREVPVRVLVGAPAELEDRFDPWGCVLPSKWEQVRADVPDAILRVVPGPVAQAEEAVAHLSSLDSPVSAEDVTIGVPDPEVVPFLTERLREHGIHARDASGIPVERTELYRLLEGLARYLQSGRFSDFAGLARHPAMEAAILRRMSTAPSSLLPALDRYQNRHLQARFARRRLPGAGERDAELVDEARRALSSLLGLGVEGQGRDQPRRLGEWGPWLAEVVLEVFGREERAAVGESDRRLEEVSRRLGGILDRMEGVPASLDPPVGASSAIALILEELRSDRIPSEADRDAVELLGWLELALDDAPVVTLTGANEPHVPESTTSHPYLPHSLRSELGLLDNRGRWARDLLSLQTVLHTRQEVRIIAGRRDAAGNPIRLSRLLLAEAPPVLARRLVAFLDEHGDGRTDGDGSAPSAPGEDPAGAPVAEEPVREGNPGSGDADRFQLPPQRVLSAEAPPAQIRVTDFRALLADPYAYALERVLRLERVDDDVYEMDPLVFGTLAHRVLERFGRSQMEEDVMWTDPDPIRARLYSELDREKRERFGSLALPAVRLQVEQLRARLAAFARWQAEWSRAGWRIRAVEASAGEGASLDVDGTPIRLRGTIDRIDENPDTGEWCIFDYKTGNQAYGPEKTHRAGRRGERRWIDLQLPLYRVLARTLERSDGGGPLVPPEAVEDIRLGYVVLPRDPDAVGCLFADWSTDELAAAEALAAELVRFVRKNRFEYDPETSAIDARDDLAVVVGRGVLGSGKDGDGEVDVD